MEGQKSQLRGFFITLLAKDLCKKEGGRFEIVVPAAWLHDLVVLPKDSPLRSQASRMSAEHALEFLRSIGYPEEHLSDIAHAIESHSFSASTTPRTLEARIVQDADRLDGLGAIGVARCFVTAGLLKRPLYAAEDPFCRSRNPDDQQYTVDHFYRKLFKVAEQLQTESGRVEGIKRVQRMRTFLRDLELELHGRLLSTDLSPSSGPHLSSLDQSF